MNIEAWITITDEKGHVESHKKANSLVINFIDLLCVQASGVSATMTDTGGTPRTVNVTSANWLMTAGAGTISNGIRVGTGPGAVELADTVLNPWIIHGTGSGNLSHGANSVSQPVTSGTSRQFTISRTFTNNTTNPISVTDVALIANGATSAWSFLIDHTLSSFTINAGLSKTVTYTVKVTV